MPDKEITGMLVVPPLMSTTIKRAVGNRSPAPIAAAIASSTR